MFDSNQFFGGERGFYPLNIEQSLRFNDDDSAYLSRTPASEGNRKTWTWSGWVKRGNLTAGGIFEGNLYFDTTNFFTGIRFTPNTLAVQDVGSGYNLYWETSAVFRDPSAWYHIVVTYDTTQASSSDALHIYVNGVEQTFTFTAFTGSYSQNRDSFVSATNTQSIGTIDSANHLDGYLAEVHFVDGTAYDADAFGEFKSGVWVAKSPSVTYGTNGFYLDFANSADIGNDVSGEGNDWTPNNFTASDVVLDSPTDNYATLNPLDQTAITTIANGNLDITTNGTTSSAIRSGFSVSSGKWYWEVTCGSFNTAGTWMIGLSLADVPITSSSWTSPNGFYYYGASGQIYNNSSSSAFGDTFTTNDVIGIALDADTGKIWFSKNGVWQASGDPASGLSPAFNESALAGRPFSPNYGSGLYAVTAYHNFGQLGFTYTPPTGYLALSTANLPEPTISPADDASPSDYFNTVLYTGNGSTQSITGVGFQPDCVWVKGRNNVGNHLLADAVRGALKALATNLTNAETDPDTNGLTSFDVDGFSAGSATRINGSGNTYVAWNWKAGGSGVSNTDGTITSTVSANTTSGFSIVEYTSNSGSVGTVGHGLDSAPDMIVFKNRDDGTTNWSTYHSSLGATKRLRLNLTAAEQVTDWMNGGTEPTTSVFTVGTSSDNNNGTDSIIAYCFHSVEGFSKFGSYTGNGSADGPFVYTGFRPAWVMIKRSDAVNDGWYITDSTRSIYNQTYNALRANASNAESGEAIADLLSNGFKIRIGANNNFNANGGTYIYMAFADDGGPFKYSLSR